MKCPVDGAELAMSERNGIEIDYCPHCRGVWLDRGELDKILDRAAGPQPVPQARNEPRYSERPREEPRYDPAPRYDPRQGKPYRKRRESFLDDLFDFD